MFNVLVILVSFDFKTSWKMFTRGGVCNGLDIMSCGMAAIVHTEGSNLDLAHKTKEINKISKFSHC